MWRVSLDTARRFLLNDLIYDLAVSRPPPAIYHAISRVHVFVYVYVCIRARVCVYKCACVNS